VRIRTGFVSNSSSTSFLIVTKGDFTLETFLEVAGAAPGTAIGDVFVHLYEAMTKSIRHTVDYGQPGALPPETLVKGWANADISAYMLDRMREAAANGEVVMYGELSSEETPIETFFCVDSFELTGEDLYVNALQGSW
jgi:hypothetical protein